MNKELFDIVSIGETLVDCLVQDCKTNLGVTANPGGAPANVLAAATKLGLNTAFIGKVGDDVFGKFLVRTMDEAGINTQGVVFCDRPTTMAIVSLDESGNRSFSFIREGSADIMLEPAEVNYSLIDRCRLLHFGTVSMTADPSCSATKESVLYARKAGKKISFDPNLRPSLWKNEEDMRAPMIWGLEHADYVKLSEEEQEYLTGISNPISGGREIMRRFQIEFLAVTMGAKGMVMFTREHTAYGPSFDVKTVDTTGAGDAMWGATLTYLVRNEFRVPGNEKKLMDLVDYANAGGSCATTRYGAILSMPNETEISECIATTQRMAAAVGLQA